MAASEVEDLIFGEICRCCMVSKPRMKQMFDTNLFAMLNAITGLNVHQNDGLPSQLCVPCVLQIRRSHFFKMQCETTDTTLRSYAGMKASNQYDCDNQPRTIKIDHDSTSAQREPGAPAADENDGDVKKYYCHECPKEFVAQKNLKRHLRTHFLHKPYSCTDCDMTFADRSNLKKHMRKHTGEVRNSEDKPHLCSECGKSFKYGTSLSRHKRLHAQRNLFNCPDCDKSYVEQTSLDVHMRTHTNERPFACTSCDKSFAQRANLERHERIHTGEKPYRCDVCGKCFTQKSYLCVHKRIHSNEKPFECGTCGKCFISRNALHKHQLRPCGIMPHSCSICKKQFQFKKTLRLHRRTHHQDISHRYCHMCEIQFANAAKLQLHMRAHHPNVCAANDSDYLQGVEIKRERRTQVNRLRGITNGEEEYVDDGIEEEERDLAGEEEEEEEFDEDEELEEEEEDEDIEIEENVSFLDEYEEMPEESESVAHPGEAEVVHAVVYDNSEAVEQETYGDLIVGDYDQVDIKRERLLEIKIMDPDEEDSDNEH